MANMFYLDRRSRSEKRRNCRLSLRKMKKEVDLTAIHPGEVLLEDYMKPLGLKQYRVAKDVGVSTLQINQIVRGKRAITAEIALRLARYFKTSPDVWLRMQARYDLEMAQKRLGNRIVEEVKILELSL